MWFGLLSVLLAPVAGAADGNANGCDDAYEANGACVSTTASVDPSVTVGGSSQVRARASVGPRTAIGSGVTIGVRAALAGRDDHASNPVTIGNDVIIGRSVTLGPDHVLGAGTVLSRSVTAGSDLTTGANASVGYASQLGSNVTLGDASVIGSLVNLGDYTVISNSAVLARSVTISSALNSIDGTVVSGVVGPEVSVGTGVEIQAGARVRKRAVIAEGATVESTARVGRDVTVGADSIIRGSVRAGAVIGEGATVGDGAIVARGAEVCASVTVPDDANVGDVYPPEGCVAATGCHAILLAGGSTGDGLYTIDPDGAGGEAPIDAYCDMTTDGGGWTLVSRVKTSTTAHRDVAAVGTLTSPGQASVAKLADVDINALRGPDYLQSVVRFTCGTLTTYFQEDKTFDATALSAGAIDRCASTWDATTWYESTPYSSHGGLNTYGQTANCGYIMYTLGDNSFEGCYSGIDGYNQDGAMWVK